MMVRGQRCPAFAFLLFLAASIHAAGPIPINDPVEGQKLARELREMTPTEDASFKGTLRIFSTGIEPRDVPLQMTVDRGNKIWNTTYLARPTNAPQEALSVNRAYDVATNHYQWQRGKTVVTPSGNFATNSFAGSDFALLDLGLEFFHWPTQTLAFKEMRKGRGCDVLESRPALPSLYSRVLSWIDQETKGLLMAEAYDTRGKLLKEFEIKSFKKVGGVYQLSEMEIRNRQTKTRTRLQFEFPER